MAAADHMAELPQRHKEYAARYVAERRPQQKRSEFSRQNRFVGEYRRHHLRLSPLNLKIRYVCSRVNQLNDRRAGPDGPHMLREVGGCCSGFSCICLQGGGRLNLRGEAGAGL
jgi:hypothetical protein